MAKKKEDWATRILNKISDKLQKATNAAILNAPEDDVDRWLDDWEKEYRKKYPDSFKELDKKKKK